MEEKLESRTARKSEAPLLSLPFTSSSLSSRGDTHPLLGDFCFLAFHEILHIYVSLNNMFFGTLRIFQRVAYFHLTLHLCNVRMLMYVAATHLFLQLDNVPLGDCNTLCTSGFLLMDAGLLPGFAMNDNDATRILVYIRKNPCVINT